MIPSPQTAPPVSSKVSFPKVTMEEMLAQMRASGGTIGENSPVTPTSWDWQERHGNRLDASEISPGKEGVGDLPGRGEHKILAASPVNGVC